METETRVSILSGWHHGITFRLTVMFLLLILALLLVVGSILIFVANRSQRAQVQAIQSEIATKAALTLELYLEDVQRKLIDLVRQPNLMAMGEAERQTTLQNFLEYRIDYVTYQGTFVEVALVTPAGFELAKLSNTRKFNPADFTYRAHEGAFRIANRGENYFGPVHQLPGSEAMVFTLAAPILGAGTQFEGVAVVEVSVARMWEAVLPIEVGRTGYKYLVGGDDTLIAADTKRPVHGEVVPDQVRLFRPILGAHMEAQEYRGVLGEQVVASAASVGRTGWMVLAELPTSEAYSGVRQMIFLLIGLLVLSAVLAGLMTVHLARRVVQPIHSLRAGARLIGQGHLDHLITVNTQDELADLAAEFNRMTSQLRESYADLEHRVMERTAELAVINQELEAFSYSVSHDLRAPLRSIDGFSQALLEDYEVKLDTRGKDYLQRVRSASQRMGELIDDLLNLSRVTRTEMRRETVDLTALAQTVAAELKKAQPERDVTFVSEEGLVANGDLRLLRVALENLLGNAWKFTEKRPKARIEFGAIQHNATKAYMVRDNGAGFDMAYADKLFNPFQRLHGANEFEGTGIGLATVQRIIRRHGGSVWAEGAVGQGATFYFTLS